MQYFFFALLWIGLFIGYDLGYAAANKRAESIRSGEEIHIVVPKGVTGINFKYFQQGTLVVNQNMEVAPTDRFIITVK